MIGKLLVALGVAFVGGAIGVGVVFLVLKMFESL